MGFKTSPVLECLAQYFLSNRTPLRIDLMSATLTGWAGPMSRVVWLPQVSTPVQHLDEGKSESDSR